MEITHNKFNGGIWSDVLKGRYDLGNYKAASRTCENFIPTRYGQVEKRAGTKHLGFAKYDGKVCVLRSFQFSVTTKFILEIGGKYIRFWSNDLRVESAGSPLEVVTPYLESELYELQTRAINDVVYITHPNHPVGKLTRIADDNWTYAEADLNLPFVDPDNLNATLTATATTGVINLYSNYEVFEPSHVGSIIRMEFLKPSSTYTFNDRYMGVPFDFDTTTYTLKDNAVVFDPTLSGVYGPDNATKNTRVYKTVGDKDYYYTVKIAWTFIAWDGATTYNVNSLVSYSGVTFRCLTPSHFSPTAPNIDPTNWLPINSPDDAPDYFEEGVNVMLPTTVGGEWSIQTTGNWTGKWQIERSIDNGLTWNLVRPLISAEDSNYLVEEDESGEQALIRVLGIYRKTGAYQLEDVTFTALQSKVYGTAEITTYVSGIFVFANVIDELLFLNTGSWQESAFSARQGYPRSVALFDGRLLFAGTKRRPQAFFYSAINEYDNFLAENTLADSPFFIESVSDDQSAVQWITTQRELFVGTASTEGVLTTRKQDEAQSPENLPVVRWNESMGSAHREAVPLRDSLLILQRGRTVLNLLSYSIERDGYTGEEVSLLCPQLFSSGVVQMAHLREPYTGAFTVQEDGTICHMIYEPKLQVTGWCKYTTQKGNFESISVLPSSGNESTDEDEVWVSVARTINGITRRHIEHFQVGNAAKQEASDIDNMWYLDAAEKRTGSGMTSVFGLGHLEGETISVLADGIKDSYVVSGGSINLNRPADTVIAGLPVTSTFEPFDLESQNTAGKRKQLYQSKLMLWRSLGGSIAHDGQDYKELVYHTAGELMDESVPLKDGYTEVFHESAYARQKYWRIQHDEPYPFTLQAVVQTFTVSKN